MTTNKLNAGNLNIIRWILAGWFLGMKFICQGLWNLQLTFFKFKILGYQVISWRSQWCLLLSSASNNWHFINWRSRFCMPGMDFLFKSKVQSFQINLRIFMVVEICSVMAPRPTWKLRFIYFFIFCQVWDIRSKAMVFALSGHDNTVCSVFARPTVCKLLNDMTHWYDILYTQ